MNDRSQYDIPVVFIFFNRPDVTRRVFAEVARQRPKQLFLVSDGARLSRVGEAERVQETRSIVESIDWPCEVHRNYADKNMGCKQRVASGISWVFEHVDRAVILEDDCLPSPAFFNYCRDMLARYQDNKRIFSISGSQFGPENATPGHYFSSYALMWGWATWKDRWSEYRLEPDDYVKVVVRTWWRRPLVLTYWWQVIRSVAVGSLDTWDLQWLLTVWRNNAVVCRPTHNLVQNLGFGVDATHTTKADNHLGRIGADTRDFDYSKAIGTLSPDKSRDKEDERQWALINARSVLLMSMPWLAKLKVASV